MEEAAEEEGEEPEDVASQMAGSLPEGYEALGKPFTDDQGNTILQGQDEEGNTVIVRRATDEEGNTIDSIFSAQGELLDEEVVEEPAEDEEPVDEATQMAESMPEGYTLTGEPTTDEEGRTVLTGEDEQGRTVTIRREIDDAGNVVDRVYDSEGNLMDERIIENPASYSSLDHDDPTLRAGGQLRRLFVAGQRYDDGRGEKGTDGLLGGGLLRLDLLAPPESTTTTVESSDSEDYDAASSESASQGGEAEQTEEAEQGEEAQQEGGGGPLDQVQDTVGGLTGGLTGGQLRWRTVDQVQDTVGGLTGGLTGGRKAADRRPGAGHCGRPDRGSGRRWRTGRSGAGHRGRSPEACLAANRVARKAKMTRKRKEKRKVAEEGCSAAASSTSVYRWGLIRSTPPRTTQRTEKGHSVSQD